MRAESDTAEKATTLRILHSTRDGENHEVRLELNIASGEGTIASGSFAFAASRRDQEDIRWYLEDYLDYPFDPASEIATQIEGRMAVIGQDLFSRVFHSTPQARSLWEALSPHLASTVLRSRLPAALCMACHGNSCSSRPLGEH